MKKTNTFNNTKKELQEYIAFYKHLLELAPEAIVIHSEGKIIYLNPAARKLIGAKKANEVIGRSVWEFIHKDSVPLIKERIKKMLDKKKVAPFATEKFITLKGDTLVAETKAVPFTFRGKLAILAILRDVTSTRKHEEQQAFLNDISKILSSSIDYKTTLKNICDSIVPALADYSRIILIDENKQTSEIVAHHLDQKKLKRVKELYGAYKRRTDVTHGIEKILSSGKSEIIEKMTPQVIERLKDNKQLSEILGYLGLVSYMGVPLKVRGKVIGALTFSSIKKDRFYSKDDLQFAEEVARRIASAIENARLYNQAQQTVEAEARLSAIVASSDDAIISKTLEGIITSWNKAAEKMYGYTAKEAVSKSIALIVPKHLWDEEVEILNKIRKGGHIAHFETVRLRKDGKPLIVSLTMSPIRNERGKIIGISKIARDITEKKKNENELAHLASLVNSSSDAIWSRSLDYRILSWNKGAELMFGYTAKEAVGAKITDLVIPTEKQEEVKIINERVLNGEQIHALETVRVTRDKKKLDVSVTASPIKNPQSTIVGISAIVRNITEQKEQEKLKDEFISMASHELKTPITSMKMFLDILYHTLSDTENINALNYVNRIKDQANKIRDLVNDLLDVSRIGNGKLRFDYANFYLDEILEDTIEGMQPALRKHNLILKKNDKLPVYGDRFRIYQVITNLLTNATKYSPKSNRVIIAAKKVNGEALVSVKDFGIGIAKDKQKKIFEKLYQVTDPHEKTFPGLGMGLYISHEIIKRHKGEIWVESQKGKGSTFYFSLPLKSKKGYTK